MELHTKEKLIRKSQELGIPFDCYKSRYEALLNVLKDIGIIKNWFYNGEYNIELNLNE